MSHFIKFVPCPECDGTCRVWILLKGSGVQTTAPCPHCLFGRVSRRMTREEVLSALDEG